MCFFFCFSCVSSLYSQINFSGSWVLVNKENLSGPEYPNALPNGLIITQKIDSFLIESVGNLKESDEIAKIVLPLNGIMVLISGSTIKRKITKDLDLSNDKRKATIETIFYMPNDYSAIDCKRTETWELSEDGKLLNIYKISEETRRESWKVKGIFERQ